MPPQILAKPPQKTGATVKDPRNQQAISVLFLAAAPLAIAFVGDDPGIMLVHGAVLAYFALAFWWLSIGMKRRKLYDEASVAKRPRIPFLLMGSALLGVVLAVLIMTRTGSPADALVQGGLAAVLGMVAFGIDPLRDKGLETDRDIRVHAAQTLRDEAAARLVRLRSRIGDLDDADLTRAADAFCRTVALMLQALSDDPDRHREIRRHLGHYLKETVEVNDRFVMQYRSTGDEEMRREFLSFLIYMDQQFRSELRTFATGGRDSMEVQVSALTTRLGKTD